MYTIREVFVITAINQDGNRFFLHFKDSDNSDNYINVNIMFATYFNDYNAAKDMIYKMSYDKSKFSYFQIDKIFMFK